MKTMKIQKWFNANKFPVTKALLKVKARSTEPRPRQPAKTQLKQLIKRDAFRTKQEEITIHTEPLSINATTQKKTNLSRNAHRIPE